METKTSIEQSGESRRGSGLIGKLGVAAIAISFALPGLGFASIEPAPPAISRPAVAQPAAPVRYADADDYYRPVPHYSGDHDAWRDQHENRRMERQDQRFNTWQNRREHRFENRQNRRQARHNRHEMREQRRFD